MKQSTKIFLVLTGILILFGVLIFGIFFLLIGNFEGDDEIIRGKGGKIAIVELQGEILKSDEIVRQLKKYREDKSIKGILFRIDSPGGGVAASQEIYEEVKEVRKSGKPIVVSMGSVAASGGYYIACPATKIVANPGTITGSIGVISVFMRLDPLLEKIGIKVNTIKSGKFKDAGNPFREMTTEDKKYWQDLMDAVHQQFIQAVETERNFDRDEILKYSQGQVFTGEYAKKIGLVDTLGTFECAISITAELAGIKEKPTIVKEKKRRLSIIDHLLQSTKVDELLNLKEEIFNQPILQYKMIPEIN